MRRTARPYWGALSLAAVSLPLLLLLAWYAGSAWVRFDRYRRASGAKITLNAELLQLFMHDEMHRHIRRFSLAPSPGTLDSVELSIPADGMQALEDDARSSGKRRYVKAFLRRSGQTHKVRIRLQGRRHWHHIGVQKSLKVRAEKGDLIDGLRTFNLVNDVTPFGLEEKLVLDVAEALDLLTPTYEPVRVRMNNTDAGVYWLVGTPDEGLLRRAGRMPGSMYSGRFDRPCDPAAPGPRADKPCGFAKLAARDAGEREDFAEIFDLHRALRDGTFKTYAPEYLDLDRFARFEALDVVFGGDQHDEGSSFKIYFDPYRGRFEPVAMDFRAFRHDNRVNLASNLLQRELQLIPEYMRLRNRWIHRLATGLGSPAQVRERVEAWFAKLRPELETDPYWDAYKLLPKASKFHRLMVRPMTIGRWLLASRAELETHSQRSRFLVDKLESAQLELSAHFGAGGPKLDARASGLASFQIVAISADGGQRCEVSRGDGPWLNPIVEAKARPGQDATGAKRTIVVPTRRTLDLDCRGATAGVLSVTAENVVTGRVRRMRVPILAAAPPAGVPPARTATVAASPAAALELISLGPGLVRYDRDVTFGSGSRVTVHAGTTVQLGAGASIAFEGGLQANGTAHAPIRFERAAPDAPFGGVMLIGPDTRGARLSYVRFWGGTHPTGTKRYTPGFLNIYDTSDIQLSNVWFEGITGAEDVLHATYVDGLDVSDLSIVDAPTDAIDLEMVTGTLRGLRVSGAGDECLDLMGAALTVTDSVLAGCTNNAVSAGEESKISLDSVLIAGSKVGVLAKNASQALVTRSLIFDGKQALRTNKKDVHYTKPSRIEAEALFVHEVDDLVKRGRGTTIVLFRSTRGLPDDDQLLPLRRDVLQIDAWRDEPLAEYLRRLRP